MKIAHAGWLDTFWCIAFTLASVSWWLWLYWQMTQPIQS